MADIPPKLTEDTIKKSAPVNKDEAPLTPQEEEAYAETAQKIERTAIDPKTLSAAEIENLLGWKRRQTLKELNEQPKVPILIPHKEGEDRNNKANHYHFFGINGVFIYVRKGKMVYVPQQIAELWEESQREQEASEDMLVANIDMKIDPITGQKKSSSRLI